MRPLLIAGGVCVLLALPGCSKVKSLLGKGEDGGVASGGALPAGKAGVGPLGFLNGFEGQIDVLARGKLSSSSKANAPTTVSLLMKEGKIRADVPPGLSGNEQMGHVYGIYDGPGKKLSIVMDAQKQAIVIDLNKAGEHLKSVGGPHAPHTPGGAGGPSKPPPKVTKTGKSDTVAGYTCEIWEITDEGSRAQMCIASESVSWFSIPLTGAPAEFAWMTELMDGKHFPLRFIGYDKANAEEGRIEVTKVEKKPEADAQFVVPPGYKIMSLDQMFQPGFQPGAPGGPIPPGGRRPPHP